MNLPALLSRVFGPAEEINGHERCPTYLYRWHVAALFGCKVYVHHFVGDDWSYDLHDHPKRFITVGVKGRYLEWLPTSCRWYRAPWVRSFPAEHRHRITVEPGEECWTLVLVLRTSRVWGFWHDGRFVPWRDYVMSEDADRAASCR